MSTSILESLMSSIDPQMLGSIASKMGENKDSVRSGMQGGAATLLSALAGKASDTGFMGQLMGMLNNPALGGGALSNIGSLLGGGSSPLGDLSGKFLSLLLGSKLGSIGEMVAKAAGLGSGSASGLMSLVAPLLLGTLSQKVKSSGLGASALGSLLSSEASGLSRFLPSGIGSLLGSLPGVPSMSAATHHAHEAVKETGTNWLWPALGLALLLGGLLWFFNRGETPRVAVPDVSKVAEKAADTAASATSAVSDAAKSAWAALGEFFKRKLPNGIEINIPRLGIENKLIDFVEDKTKMVDKTTWFDFDRLLFDTGKATLQPASQQQLEDVANILKAYPTVEMKIGGYTDSTGDKAANMKLSAERAKNVMDALTGLGIPAARLTSEGYGDQHPVADNATEEGRAKNRRISMRVTKK
jgi:OmpA-OmpF porin, OOP family